MIESGQKIILSYDAFYARMVETETPSRAHIATHCSFSHTMRLMLGWLKQKLRPELTVQTTLIRVSVVHQS